MSKTTFSLSSKYIRCPQCGGYASAAETRCPNCDYPIAPPTPTLMGTGRLGRRPAMPLIEGEGRTEFLPNASLIFQFLPSGSCLSLDIEHKLILGRGPSENSETVIDLTPFNGLQHGVSRRHCTLKRQGTQLIVVDLDSTNGTYLNGEPLLPHRKYVIADGDRLILGTLHIAITFNTAASQDSCAE